MPEHASNGTGISRDVTACLPRDKTARQGRDASSIDERWGKPVAEIIPLLTHDVPEAQFHEIRRSEPKHTFAKYTYFARCENTGNIKIGRSFTPAVRMQQLQTATGSTHTLLATIRGGENESSYHMIFDEYRVFGEWFSPAPEILTEIARLNADTPA